MMENMTMKSPRQGWGSGLRRVPSPPSCQLGRSPGWPTRVPGALATETGAEAHVHQPDQGQPSLSFAWSLARDTPPLRAAADCELEATLGQGGGSPGPSRMSAVERRAPRADHVGGFGPRPTRGPQRPLLLKLGTWSQAPCPQRAGGGGWRGPGQDPVSHTRGAPAW